MKTIFTAVSVLLLMFSATPSAAQSASSEDLGAWYILMGDEKIAKRWVLSYDFQYRNQNIMGDLDQLLLRSGVGYDLSENNNNLLLGYAYVLQDIDGLLPEQISEHRIYQQFLTKQKFGRVALSHRYRFEQRFLRNRTDLRMRYFLSVNVPLSSPEMKPQTLYFSAYNEVFINMKKDAFDQNRLYGALGYVVSPKIRLEAGLLNQHFGERKRNLLQIRMLTSNIFAN
ncbi:DUF2490 domain-containing protein [Sphingobacterium spiritivorum]|uniref:DUF2490 domain-containing protein n=1 Tax=Sphingobacterium spiritivorum TaxID=258 RepID=UPI00191B3D55|nr:DUF2490 domain-containing protein [Sphingobacterium spiritivorum]QQT25958.1 DUF2490 domain-containing protein [Sphingobacterium spiritivorum]